MSLLTTFEKLGLRKAKGWFRIWMIFSVIWVVAIAGIVSYEYTKKQNYRESLRIRCSQVIETGKYNNDIRCTEFLRKFTLFPENKSHFEEYQEQYSIAFALVGPPLGIPLLLLVFLSMYRWVAKGFKES